MLYSLMIVVTCVVSIVDGESCEPIDLPLCKDVGYNFTKFPNSLGYADQTTATKALQIQYQDMNDECTDDMKDFLCTLYLPKCQPDEDSNGIVLPTRQQCEKAFNGCIFMAYTEIDSHHCEQFPEAVEECQNVEISACRDIGYKMTRLPNSFNHTDQNSIRSFFRLMTLGCDDAYKEFLCQLYLPQCDSNNEDPKLPTRDLCQKAKKGCEKLIQTYGKIWDLYYNCDTFPEKKKEWYTDFDHPETTNGIQLRIKYSPTALTFTSCCQVYSYSEKEFILPINTEVKVHTADVRSSSVPTVSINGASNEYNKSVYSTLMAVSGYNATQDAMAQTFHIYTNWMVVNIRHEDVSTGITVKEYEGPLPTSQTDNKVFFLLYSHSKMINIWDLGNFNNPQCSRYEMDINSLVKNNTMVLLASTKMLVDVDEYSRYRSMTENEESESELCANVPNYPKTCSLDSQAIMRTFMRK